MKSDHLLIAFLFCTSPRSLYISDGEEQHTALAYLTIQYFFEEPYN